MVSLLVRGTFGLALCSIEVRRGRNPFRRKPVVALDKQGRRAMISYRSALARKGKGMRHYRTDMWVSPEQLGEMLAWCHKTLVPGDWNHERQRTTPRQSGHRRTILFPEGSRCPGFRRTMAIPAASEPAQSAMRTGPLYRSRRALPVATRCSGAMTSPQARTIRAPTPTACESDRKYQSVTNCFCTATAAAGV